MYRGGDFDDAVDIVDIWLREERPADYYEPAAEGIGRQFDFDSSELFNELINNRMYR